MYRYGSLLSNVESFLKSGGFATQYQLAEMFGTSHHSVRGTISVLRSNGLPITKVLSSHQLEAAYYQLASDVVIPKLGRPAHKNAVAF